MIDTSVNGKELSWGCVSHLIHGHRSQDPQLLVSFVSSLFTVIDVCVFSYFTSIMIILITLLKYIDLLLLILSLPSTPRTVRSVYSLVPAKIQDS